MQVSRLFLLFLFFFANYGFGVEMKRLKDQVVVVTGASKGIGHEMAKVFAREGAKLVLVARNEVLLKELSDELGSIYVTADVSIKGDMDKVVETALKKW